MDFTEQIPEFLNHLDSNRELAVAGFQRFAETLFEQAPPPNYFRVPPDDREDVVSEVILHCIDDDCAKLRKYKPRAGCAFAGWFAVVATRKITDFLRQRQRRDRELDGDGLPDGHGDSGTPDPEQLAIKNELERMFLSALRSIGQRCRLLLRLKVLEFKNREIVRVLRLPKDQNKAIGNQVLECRKKLIRELRDLGFFGAKRAPGG
jgi:RNA polymerase sigma factor (sigma-70 family)